MIDINYVQGRLDQESIDMCLPLRSWVRDLITEVRKSELAIAAYKETISEFQGAVHDLETRCDPAGDIQTIASLNEQVGGLTNMVNELQNRMACASDQFDRDNFVTGMDLLRMDYERPIDES